MVAGREATEIAKVPIAVEGGAVENVKEFPYQGSVIASSETVDADVETRVAKASCAIGALRTPVFMDKNLRHETKCRVYHACVLAVLLYGSEC